jgi:ABC-type branched-subunit amino acid transport system permease subunit
VAGVAYTVAWAMIALKATVFSLSITFLLPLFLGGTRVVIGPRAVEVGAEAATRDVALRVRGHFGGTRELVAS